MMATYIKMNGLKNDFLVFQGPVEISSQKVAELCNRRSGIGADGVLVVTKVDAGRIRMDYWNSDGSKAEMCGNGLRCVARYAVSKGMVAPGEFDVETPAGKLKVSCSEDLSDDIEVQVGKVRVEPSPVELHGMSFYVASVGNPHAITFVRDVASAPVHSVGPKVENDEHFPNKTNVEFVEEIDKGYLKLRVWERGVGETKACGTGMVSAAVVSSRVNQTTLPMTVEVPGGIAQIWIDDDGYVRMRAPVEIMLTGKAEIR
jgi:diaminopimelate epimerase